MSSGPSLGPVPRNVLDPAKKSAEDISDIVSSLKLELGEMHGADTLGGRGKTSTHLIQVVRL